MERVRRSSVGGSWYPADPRRLAGEVDRHVADASVGPLPHPPRALISPHAGLMYSGPVAAFGYKAAHETPYSTVILVGPSHFVPFSGVSVWPAGTWDTPFGAVGVDETLAAAIRAQYPEVIDMPEAHGREHAIEMQLPFVAHLLPGAAIVPLIMGRQTREASFALGGAIARVIAARTTAETPTLADAAGRRAPAEAARGGVLIVASSDLSHYEDADTAMRLDAVIVRHVEALDPEGLMQALEREPRHACGGGPMVAVLHAARQLGATTARVLRYADSGDVSGDKRSVVGYMSAAVW